MPLFPALGRQRQADLSEFKASLFYRVSSRTARDTQRNSVSEKQNQTKQQQKNPITPVRFPRRKHDSLGRLGLTHVSSALVSKNTTSSCHLNGI